MSMLVTVSPKFQVVIPKEIRERMEIIPGQQLQAVSLGREFILVPIEKDIKKMRGFLGKINTSDLRDHSERFK
ncbi:MAG: AbrB/MazE/SpoVT family DNA-binding domain-containing protein [Candidatus Micrarchaeota archaeon]